MLQWKNFKDVMGNAAMNAVIWQLAKHGHGSFQLAVIVARQAIAFLHPK